MIKKANVQAYYDGNPFPSFTYHYLYKDGEKIKSKHELICEAQEKILGRFTFTEGTEESWIKVGVDGDTQHIDQMIEAAYEAIEGYITYNFDWQVEILEEE